MKKIYKISLKVFLLIVFSFCVFNIISSYAAEPIFKITGIAVKEKSTGVTVNDVDLNNDEIINNVLFTDVNDYITYDLKLKNTSSEEYTIKSITDNNNSEYLNYSYDNLSNVVLNAGEEKDLNLTITYIKQATDPNLSVGETNLIITYEKVNGDEGQEEVTPSVNPDQEDKGSPKTGDNVIIYFILGGASLICLILLSKSKKKSNLMIIALAILIPVCVKANSLKLSIKFNNTVKALSYDVEINLDNGSSIIYKSLAKGGKLAQPETPSKRGYSFDNWYLNDAVYDFNSIITGPISLEAKYTKDTYQISYDLDGGSLEDGKSNQTEYDIDSTFTLYNPTKQGYDFVGWRLEGTTETVSTVTISNEVGNKSYKAIYTPKTDTIYHVIHKYRKLNSQEFDEEVFEGRGTTDSVIELDFKPKTGFVNPTSKKKLKILADETASSEYVYEREEYSFTLTDTANVTSDTSNGNYQYGTIINVTANNIDGYTFTKWSNDVTTNTQQITLTGNLTLSPIYTANTDTPYTVVHKYQQVTGDGFDEEVEENTVGTTDTTIDVDYKPRTGFITPTTSKKLTITGDGQAKKEYTYLREEYTFTLEDPDNIVTTDTVSGTYRYGKVINLTVGSKPGHTFTKWSNDVTDASQQITLTNNLTISPVYTPDKYDITFDPDNGNTPSVIKATYGTYITAPSVNPTKEGFTFSYWKLNDVQFDFNNTQITGPITLVAVYTANGDTPYTVKHRYQHIDDNNFDEVIDENTTGTTGDTITVPYKTLTGFVEPTTNQELTITGNGQATKVYEYLREEHTFTLNNIDNLVTSTVSNGTYRYGKEITLTAGSKQGCTFVKWSNNETNATYTFTLTDDVTISPIYTCTVELNPNNGESITYQQVEYGTKVTKPSTNPEKPGYTFNYWMSNDQEYDFDTLVTGPVSLTANYTLDSYTITYVLDGGTLADGYPQSYDYEHSVNLPSPTKQGYDFDGWMVTGTSEIISSEIPVHSTGNKSFTAHYTPKTNTKYTVIRKYQNINDDNYTESTPEIYYGTTDSEVTIEYNTPTGFNDPSQSKKLTITADGEAVKVYEYDRITYTYSFDNQGYNATSSVPSGTYKYGKEITVTAGEEEAYNFANWSNDVTTNPYTFTLTKNVSISPVYNVKTYTVSFVTGTTETVPSQTVDYGETASIPQTEPFKEGYIFNYWELNDAEYNFSTPVTGDIELVAHYTIDEYDITYVLDGGTVTTANPISYNINTDTFILNNPTKEGYSFIGWTGSNGSTPQTTVTITKGTTGDKTYTAHYEEQSSTSIVCKKTTTLHTETCNSADGKGCRSNGFNVGDIITYGNVVSSDNYVPGDAFDCDVDGSGYNQRFYYIRTIDDKAVLINNMNFTAASGQADQDTSGNYTWALGQLPTTSQWTNLPVTFDDKAARLITQEDILEMTGVQSINNLTSNWSLSDFKFLFENSNYSGIHARSTQWMEETSDGVRGRYRNDSGNVAILKTSELDTSKNPVRPVIEVPLDQIDDSYVVKFIYGSDPNSTEYVYRVVSKGSSLGTLPTYSDSNHSISGWFKDTALTEPITENTVPQGYVTYYSDSKLNANQAILATSEFKLANNTTSTIVVLNSDYVEPLTYTSNDESIVTVDSEGIITAHSVGETTITIEGTYSHTTLTLHVIVSESTPKVTVSFDTHGGSSVEDIILDVNTSIGVMPSSTKDGNTLVGWYNNASYDVEIKGDNEILADVTLHAKWMPSDTVAVLNDNQYFTSIQAAIDAAPSTQSTITVMQDVVHTNTTSNSMIINMYSSSSNIGKDIIIDLNGHTLSVDVPTDKSNVYIAKNRGNLLIKNGTLTSKAKCGAVEASAGKLILENVTVTSTGIRQAAYILKDVGSSSYGDPVLEVRGGSYFESKAENPRGTLHNVDGTLIIKDATVVSTSSYAVYSEGGSVIIGTKDGTAFTSTPIIIGKTYGVGVKNDASGKLSFFDGTIKGVSDAIQSRSSVLSDDNIETNYGIQEDTETDPITELIYKVITLLRENNYIIWLEANGGTGSPESVTVVPGESINESDIITPTNGVYTFAGWYYDEELTNPVVFPVTPNKDDRYYAKWVYESSDEIVSFNINSPAMQTYFANVTTWVSGATKDNNTSFIDALRANFDNNSCSYCSLSADANSCSSPSAGTHCDKAIGKETGVTTGITVRESDETTKIKNGPIASYLTISNGAIYNMIPGTTYYWESNSDSNVYGYVKATGKRRTVTTTVRNVRDLGGLEVRFTRNNTTKTGTINYGRLYRGAQLSNGQSDVDGLVKLGVTRELDLRVKTEGTNPVRLPKHDRCNSNCSNISDADDIIMTNYLVNPNTHLSNYLGVRKALKATMEFIVNDKDNVYFHCTIGTDRTGTLAYFLEGLLGVGEEDKLEDYELTYYYGLLNRTRFHDELQGSSIKPRFYTMYQTYNTNEKIYDWFMHGRFGGGIDINTLSKSDLLLYASDLEITSVSNSNTEEEIIDAINAQLALDDQLVQDFRDEMITYN